MTLIVCLILIKITSNYLVNLNLLLLIETFKIDHIISYAIYINKWDILFLFTYTYERKKDYIKSNHS